MFQPVHGDWQLKGQPRDLHGFTHPSPRNFRKRVTLFAHNTMILSELQPSILARTIRPTKYPEVIRAVNNPAFDRGRLQNILIDPLDHFSMNRIPEERFKVFAISYSFPAIRLACILRSCQCNYDASKRIQAYE